MIAQDHAGGQQWSQVAWTSSLAPSLSKSNKDFKKRRSEQLVCARLQAKMFPDIISFNLRNNPRFTDKRN